MAIIKDKVDILKAFFSVIYVIMFTAFARLQYDTYTAEPTRINFNEESMQDIPFPAVTICDKNYKYRQLYYDLGFPIFPFSEGPKLTYTSPYSLFEKLTLVNEDIVPNMWKYYFTLDEIFYFGEDINCRVGVFTCNLRESRLFRAYPGNLSSQEAEFEVEAGVWRSRIMADSKEGDIAMCHTLIPNVSSSFSAELGNTIGFNFKYSYMNLSYLRQVYVHDRYEHVLLDTFAINTEASFDVLTIYNNDTDSFGTHAWGRFQLLPTLLNRPSSSMIHPCSLEANYSQSWCKINHNWNRKIQGMQDYYGDNFTCVSPGIWDYVGPKQCPICQHFERADAPNRTMGLRDVLFPVFKPVGISKLTSYQDPSFQAPPLGVYSDEIELGNCIPRCSRYSYSLKEEEVTEFGNKISIYAVYLYFPSPVVQVWTEFRLIGGVDFFAGVGGTLGLVLGMSILSLTFMALDMAKNAMKKIL